MINPASFLKIGYDHIASEQHDANRWFIWHNIKYLHSRARLLIAAFLITTFLLATQASAQKPSLSDALSTPPDTLAFDSTLVDTAAFKADLDTIVIYSAEKVVSSENPRKTTLTGNAKINYRKMELTAAKIEIMWEQDLVHAEGKLDTVRIKGYKRKTAKFKQIDQDSLGTLSDSSDVVYPDSLVLTSDSLDIEPMAPDTGLTPGDTIVWVGLPKMKDGTQIIDGERMIYNLKTRQGRVIMGKTGFQDGDYTGSKIKKTENDVYFIDGGYYSTCDAEPPHYTFWSKSVKMKIRDKVIARPLVLMFGPVPVLIVPFGVFPGGGGRHSGLIIPTYGETASQGRYFRNLGYYWAPNDYFDVKGTLNFYERSGIQFFADSRYAKRYVLTGGVSGSLINQRFDETVSKRWDLRVNHSHTLSPTSNLNVDGTFVSDNSYSRDYSQNLRDRLQRIIRSNATYSKRWAGTPYSSSMNLSYTKDLESGNINQTIPQITFRRSQEQIFKLPEDTKVDEPPWWNKIYYSYSGLGKNDLAITFKPTTVYDAETEDSLFTYDKKNVLYRAGIKHDVTLSSSQKVFEYFAASPRISYSEAWYDEWLEYRQNTDLSIDTLKQDGFRARRTFSTGISLNTKLYGLFYPHIFKVEAIRHTFTPTVGLNYTPDFGESMWGYYSVFQDSNGVNRYYDEFASNTLFGGTPRQKSMTMSIGLSNLFEYKQVKDEKEVKGQLFTLDMNTSHNFTKDSLKWADLSSTARTQPFGGVVGPLSGLSLTIGAAHSFYRLKEVNGSKYVISDPAPNGLRLLNFDLNSSFSIASRSESPSGIIDKDTTETDKMDDRFTAPMWKPTDIPWKLGFNIRYGEDHRDPDNVTKNAWLNMNVELSPTNNWRLNWNTRVDLINKDLIAGSISIYRDLHCWEGQLTWNPTGISKGYYLRINIKSAQLQDVKVEKQKGGGGRFFGL